MTDELPPLPEPDVPLVRGGCYTVNKMRARDAMWAERLAAAVARERDKMAPLFDGLAVMRELDDRAKARTSYENVSDVLDAAVRAIRKGG